MADYILNFNTWEVIMRRMPSFDEFFVHVYLPYAKERKRSWEQDNRMCTRHLSPSFGCKRLKELKSADVEKWLSRLHATGLKASTCNRILALLKSIVALAVTFGYLSNSPCRNVRPLKTEMSRERFLSREEGQELMRHLKRQNSRDAVIIQLLLLTGARKREILKARWVDLDLERKILTVPFSKSGKPRHIYLSDEAVCLLKGIRRLPGCEWIFPGRDPSKPVSDIYHFWNRTRKELGIADVRIHDLRHSFASFLVSAGQSLYITQQLLGHVDPRTTMRYAHFACDTLTNAVAKLPICVKSVMRGRRGSPGKRRILAILSEIVASISKKILDGDQVF